jgi:hypothetical protein
MKHLLMDPAFPDLVGQWASRGLAETAAEPCACANDNASADEPGVASPELGADAEAPTDAFVTMLARMDVAATRLW